MNQIKKWLNEPIAFLLIFFAIILFVIRIISFVKKDNNPFKNKPIEICSDKDYGLHQFYQERAQKKEEEKDYVGAIDDYHKALFYDTSVVKVITISYNIQTIKYLYSLLDKEQEGYKVAIKILDSLIEANPTEDYFDTRAQYKHTTGNLLSSIEDYKTAKKLCKYDNEDYYWKIGNAHEQLKQYYEAIQYYNEAIQIKKDKYEKASKNIKEYYDRDIQKLYRNNGDCKMNLRDFEGAILDYRKGLSWNINQLIIGSEIYNGIGVCQIKLKNYQAALVSLNISLKMNNERNTIYTGKDPKTGLTLKYPEMAYTYYLLGIAKFSLNQRRSACRDWGKSGELGDERGYEAIQEHCQ